MECLLYLFVTLFSFHRYILKGCRQSSAAIFMERNMFVNPFLDRASINIHVFLVFEYLLGILTSNYSDWLWIAENNQSLLFC